MGRGPTPLAQPGLPRPCLQKGLSPFWIPENHPLHSGVCLPGFPLSSLLVVAQPLPPSHAHAVPSHPAPHADVFPVLGMTVDSAPSSRMCSAPCPSRPDYCRILNLSKHSTVRPNTNLTATLKGKCPLKTETKRDSSLSHLQLSSGPLQAELCQRKMACQGADPGPAAPLPPLPSCDIHAVTLGTEQNLPLPLPAPNHQTRLSSSFCLAT